MLSTVTNSENETFLLAEEFIKSLDKKKNVICLFGDLGTGKTAFTKGIAKAFGIDHYTVKSPTYAFVREYVHQKGTIYHVDLYRLEKPDDILFSQIEEAAKKEGVLVVIEWADRMENSMPENRTDICFEYIDKETRKITIF
jgi:tRNA threonylcarbamoyladenosine biosynthesis protein TsaE